MAGTVIEVSSNAELEALYGNHSKLTTVLLWAPWHPPSVHLGKVLDVMAAEERSVRFGKVNTDVCPALATRLGADQVPFVAFLDPKGKRVDALAGADPPRLLQKVKMLATRPFNAANEAPAEGASASSDLNTRLKELVNYDPVMLFMKGSKVEPFCKFSRQAIELMGKHDVEFSTFDILQDNEVREGLKDFSNWKTYPQLYINGELLGGIDIMKEMDADGSLAEAWPSNAKGEERLEDRLKKLINKADVMVFMKGDPETPRCGFSGKMVALLQENKVSFDTFDILEDEDVRQGLKTYSNWPTFPQLYGHGKLIGGLDIVKELADEGSLLEELGVK
eukprot:TRINITY_DN80532_c0_g1_i1.p1 TRINITY_DN80532_c0_g1~~TRINITY_DN80532_c0_g1_i1.p1  ORF type:complete len:335 (-),score=103.42 TRINITY_DN80532_c0_g1_i1:108-1112(-)